MTLPTNSEFIRINESVDGVSFHAPISELRCISLRRPADLMRSVFRGGITRCGKWDSFIRKRFVVR